MCRLAYLSLIHRPLCTTAYKHMQTSVRSSLHMHQIKIIFASNLVVLALKIVTSQHYSDLFIYRIKFIRPPFYLMTYDTIYIDTAVRRAPTTFIYTIISLKVHVLLLTFRKLLFYLLPHLTLTFADFYSQPLSTRPCSDRSIYCQLTPTVTQI